MPPKQHRSNSVKKREQHCSLWPACLCICCIILGAEVGSHPDSTTREGKTCASGWLMPWAPMTLKGSSQACFSAGPQNAGVSRKPCPNDVAFLAEDPKRHQVSLDLNMSSIAGHIPALKGRLVESSFFLFFFFFPSPSLHPREMLLEPRPSPSCRGRSTNAWVC